MTLSQAFTRLCSGAITVEEYLEHYSPEERPHVYIPPLSARARCASKPEKNTKHRSSRCLDNFRADPFFGRAL